MQCERRSHTRPYGRPHKIQGTISYQASLTRGLLETESRQRFSSSSWSSCDHRQGSSRQPSRQPSRHGPQDGGLVHLLVLAAARARGLARGGRMALPRSACPGRECFERPSSARWASGGRSQPPCKKATMVSKTPDRARSHAPTAMVAAGDAERFSGRGHGSRTARDRAEEVGAVNAKKAGRAALRAALARRCQA